MAFFGSFLASLCVHVHLLPFSSHTHFSSVPHFLSLQDCGAFIAEPHLPEPHFMPSALSEVAPNPNGLFVH